MESTPIPLAGSWPDEMFPVLTPEQQARVLAHGQSRKTESGETVVEPNAQGMKFFLVVAGKLNLSRPNDCPCSRQWFG
ncbi:MAG TPA: hypothetical protein VHQ95_17180 [Pyrinomonadaceae bacterium]|nr:hypothetical protein [Pyrinomonadaceae bacterium]